MGRQLLDKVGFTHYTLKRPSRWRTVEKSGGHKIERGRVDFGTISVLAFDPRQVRIFPLFNETVEEVKEHFELNPGACFGKNRSIAEYLTEFSGRMPGARVVAATNGGNLYSHFYDVLVRMVEGERSFFASASCPDGARSCLAVLADGRIEARDLVVSSGQLQETPSLQGVRHAFYGQQLVRGGEVQALLENGFYRHFAGNYTHLFRFPRFVPPLEGYSLAVERVGKCGNFLGVQQFIDDPSLPERTLRQERVTLRLPNFGVLRKFTKRGEECPIVTIGELSEALENGSPVPRKFDVQRITEPLVREALFRAGYGEADFELNLGRREISLLIGRSRYPHTAIGISAGGEAGITAVFEGEHFQTGPTIEETAAAMAGFGASDSFLLGNGSEAAMYSARLGRMVNQVEVSPAKRAFIAAGGNSPETSFTFNALVYYRG